MIAQVSPGYEKAFNFLEQLGLVEADRDAILESCPDTAMAIRLYRGRYRLLLSDSDDQFSRYFDVGIRNIDTSESILGIISAQLAPHSEEVIRPWSIAVWNSIKDHPSLERFILMNWPELMSTVDSSIIPEDEDHEVLLPTCNSITIPEEHWFNPASPLMLNFIKSLFCWFRQQPS